MGHAWGSAVSISLARSRASVAKYMNSGQCAPKPPTGLFGMFRMMADHDVKWRALPRFASVRPLLALAGGQGQAAVVGNGSTVIHRPEQGCCSG
jgi:hypothetical protein